MPRGLRKIHGGGDCLWSSYRFYRWGEKGLVKIGEPILGFREEVDAANDIEGATGIKPTTVPVRPSKLDKTATD